MGWTNSSTFGKLPFAEQANEAGIVIVHLPTQSIQGKITYLTSLDEIYDVHILANKIRPNILNTITEDHKKALMIPQTTFWQKEKNKFELVNFVPNFISSLPGDKPESISEWWGYNNFLSLPLPNLI